MKTLFIISCFFFLLTQIGFTQWVSQTSGTTSKLLGVSFADANNGYAVGANGTSLYTQDGGNNWYPFYGANNITLSAVSCINGATAFAVANELVGSVWISKLFYSVGGFNWNLVTENQFQLYSISISNANNGAAVGSKIIHSTTPTNIWDLQTNPTTNSLDCVFFKDANIGTAVGQMGTIIHTTNGGNNWVIQSSGTFNGLYGVSFADINNGIAVGTYGTILRTTNGGTTWTVQSSWTSEDLFSVSFINLNNATVVGSNGIILHTTNGGASWTQQTSGTSEWLFSVSFTDANNGWIVGNTGTILHTTNGGLTSAEENGTDAQPKEYSLSQNYPNPFNPSTVINYKLPISSKVIIKIYDALGKEVSTLVNEEKPAGSYSVSFEATELSSGFYFYKIIAGNFVSTKKMILIK
jgi:photosystem II stability/assembly factor-like uncharacterized protein